MSLFLLLCQADGSEVTAEALEGKVLAVYFSASWCAPCKQFTPILKSVYSKLQKDGEYKSSVTKEVFCVAAACWRCVEQPIFAYPSRYCTFAAAARQACLKNEI